VHVTECLEPASRHRHDLAQLLLELADQSDTFHRPAGDVVESIETGGLEVGGSCRADD
jgi:hypothetical protein